MAAISETLRQARLRSGIDLDRLADKTKINPRYLQAIEAGDFGKLPSGIFARMFIKQYADAVGLDGARFAEEYQRSTSFGEDSGPNQTLPSTRSNYQPSVPSLSAVGDRGRNDRLASMLSSFIWVVAAILVCAGAYYGLAHLPSRTVVTGSSTPNPAETPTPSPAQKTPEATPATSTSAPSTSTGVNGEPATTPASPPPASASATPIQVAITASEPVWVTAAADGKTVVSELVSPGTSKTLSAEKYAKVTLGNAGGADITFNGKKLDPIGPRGQVRSVEFTPQGAQVISRTSPKADPPSKAEPAPNPDPLR